MAIMWLMLLAMRDVARSRARLADRAPGGAASTPRPGADSSSASPPVHARSLAVGLAGASLVRLAAGAGHRRTGDGHRMAPPRRSLVLDVEEPSPHGSTACVAGGPGSDSHHVADESALGCAAHPRRTG